MIDSIFARDYPVIQGLTLALAVLVSLVFLVADCVQTALDPRVHRRDATVIPHSCATSAPHSARRRRLPAAWHCGPRRSSASSSCCCCWPARIVPDWIAPYDPLAFDYRALLKPPSSAHPFGTDNFGRDILSRTIWASRVDLQIALFAHVCSPRSSARFVGCADRLCRRRRSISLFGRLVDLV